MTNLPKKTPLIKRHAFAAMAVFIFSILCSHLAFGQINNNRFRININSQDMGPCGGANDNITRVGVIAKNNSVHNFEIAFDLPDGVDYIPGDLTILNQSGSGDFVLTEADISDLNAPIFRLERPGDANWQVADVVRFEFNKTATCEAVQFSYNGGLFKDAHTITYDDLNGPQSASDTDPTINSYNFLRAYLAVLNYNNVTAELGDNIVRPYNVSNSGNGDITNFMQNIEVGNGLDNYSLSFVDATSTRYALTPTSTTPTANGTLYTYAIDLAQAPFLGNVGDGDAIFENESVQLEESFRVISCDNINVAQQPTWGCSATQVCQALSPISAEVVLDSGMPNIVVSEPTPVTNTDLCLATTYNVRIENAAATANAYNVSINNGFGPSTPAMTTATVNELWGNDRPDNSKSISNFRFGGNPSFTPDQRAKDGIHSFGAGSYFIPGNFFTTNPDGPGGLEDLDGDGFFDDLAPGESTILSFDYENHALNRACNTSSVDQYVLSYRLFTDAYAQNTCDAYSLTDRIRLNYSQFRKNGTNVTSPTDVYSNQPFTLEVQGNLVTGGGDEPFCNGIPMFSPDPSSSWTTTITVPTGVILDGSAPPEFSQTGSTITYTTTDLPYDRNYLSMPVQFPLEMDCATYTGGANMVISYSTRYSCACFDQELQCGTISMRAQCGTACDGPTITSFDAQRETPGWTDNTMTTQVTLDPSTHNLDMYMAKDEMVLRTSAVLNNANPDNLWFDLTYSASTAAGGIDVIEYLNGAITINDLSSGSGSQALDVAPQLITDSPGNFRLRFDLSSYTDLISGTYTYGEGLEADLVDLELHFKFLDVFTNRTVHELQNFSGEFFNKDAADAKQDGCTILGDRAFYFKNHHISYNVPQEVESGCDLAIIHLQSSILTVAGDRFPNEFRPPILWTSSVVDIPIGTEFQDAFVDSYSTNPGGGIFASINLIANTVTLTPDPAIFRDRDQNGDQYPNIRLRFNGSSDTPAISNFNWSYNFDDYGYGVNADYEPVADSGVANFEFEQPNPTLTSPAPVVSGDQQTASFDLTLCMESPTDIDYNWLQINNGSDFTVLRAYEISSPSTTLTMSNSGGQTWIQLDQFASGNTCKQIRFEIDYTNCSNFDFIVEHAWSCRGYPTDFTTAGYINPLTLRLEPQEAVIQNQILAQPSGPVDTCSDFNIDMEFRNAGSGDLLSPILTFDIPGDASSMVLNPIQIRYPRDAASFETVPHTLTGNTVTINLLDHPAIAANGGLWGSINSGNNIDEQIAFVRLDLSVGCNFVSNTAITYTSYGENSCGTPAEGNNSSVSTNPIVVNGAQPNYTASNEIFLPNSGTIAGCVTETISVETTIIGGPTSSDDFARIILPDGLAFDPSSFVSTNTTYPVTYNSVSTVGNHEEIIVNMPDGANNGAIPRYSFEVTPKNTLTTCSPSAAIRVENYVVTSALTCGTVSCGATEIPNGDTFENISILKPELVASSFTSNADYTTDGAGNYDYHIAFGVENSGSVDIAAGFVYDVYCVDGTGTKTGASIYNGTISQAIPAGNSISEDISFTTSSFCGNNGNLVIEFVPSASNCHCDELAIPLASEPEVADLYVVNAVDDPTASIGQTVTFTISVINDGPFDAENVALENIVPPGYTVTAIGNGGVQSGNTITWPSFDLNNGGKADFTFSATVNAPTGTAGEFDSVAQITASDQYDSDSTPNDYDGLPLEDDEAIATVNVPEADIDITKGISAISNPNPSVGEVVTFEITVVNNGPDTATTIHLEDMLPIGYTVNGASISNGGVLSGSTIAWNIASLDSGTVNAVVLTYEGTVNAPTGVAGEYTNIAQVTSTQQYDSDSTPNNFDDIATLEDDEAFYTLSVHSADLEIINTINPNSANPGDAITITVEVTNNGPNDATNVAIENGVPAGFTVTNIGNAGVQAGNVINWANLNIPNGSNVVLTYQATVNTPTNANDEYLNIVQVVAVDQFDPDSVPNNDDGDQSEDDEDNALLSPITADLSLTKTLSATSNPNPNIGESVTFEITLTNAGPNDATNVSIEDIVPSGYVLGTVNNGGIVTGNTINWTLPSVPVGAQILTYDVTVNAPTGTADEYTNVAQVTASDQYDANSTPNNDDGDQSEDDETSHTLATPTVDIEITKTADKSISFFEDTVVFTVTATNNSAYDATNIGIEDVLPPGFQLVSQTTDMGTFDEVSSIWEIPSLLANTAATLEMNVSVTDVDGYTNIAQLAYLDQIDANTDNDRDEVTITVTQDECLTVYNEFSPNGDGANDVFFIECIDQYPNNYLQVFNRWGTKVFDMKGYNNTWDGSSTGRATMGSERKLPVGTYYYTLDTGDVETKNKAGWLYISR